MSKIMEGKIGIVTGAASGIGRASALAFAEEGAKVVVSDINEADGKETVRLIKEAGGEALFFKCDVTDEKQVIALVDFTVSEYGRLDWAFNNAGIAIGEQALVDTPTEVWDRVIKTNLYGCYYSLKYEISAMVKTGGGAIVNTGSIESVTATVNSVSYGTSKYGLRGLTQHAALDYAKMGIRVNSVGPGPTDTPMIAALKEFKPELLNAIIDGIPLGRMAEDVDIANAAVFLCSDKAKHITAVHLLVDGGQACVM